MIRSISLLRPITGSTFPSLALAVKSLAKESSVGVLALDACPLDCEELCGSLLPKSCNTCCLALFKLTSKLCKTLAATPSPHELTQVKYALFQHKSDLIYVLHLEIIQLPF